MVGPGIFPKDTYQRLTAYYDRHGIRGRTEAPRQFRHFPLRGDESLREIGLLNGHAQGTPSLRPKMHPPYGVMFALAPQSHGDSLGRVMAADATSPNDRGVVDKFGGWNA